MRCCNLSGILVTTTTCRPLAPIAQFTFNTLLCSFILTYARYNAVSSSYEPADCLSAAFYSHNSTRVLHPQFATTLRYRLELIVAIYPPLIIHLIASLF
jgi:hypothetical protein